MGAEIIPKKNEWRLPGEQLLGVRGLGALCQGARRLVSGGKAPCVRGLGAYRPSGVWWLAGMGICVLRFVACVLFLLAKLRALPCTSAWAQFRATVLAN